MGGIGCPLSQYLVNSGIKELLIVDGDIVEKSNLNRQILFNLNDIFSVQKVDRKLTHSYQMYSILVKSNKRNSLLYFLKKKKIEASAHFDPPLHKQKYLKR